MLIDEDNVKTISVLVEVTVDAPVIPVALVSDTEPLDAPVFGTVKETKFSDEPPVPITCCEPLAKILTVSVLSPHPPLFEVAVMR